jgi:signal transduction histidine kinase/CheY-like chemotaxis protein
MLNWVAFETSLHQKPGRNMRSDPSSAKRTMGKSTPATRAPERAAARARERDTFAKFVNFSSEMLATALTHDANLDDLLARALKLVKNVAKSDIEIVCLRAGNEWRCRTAGLENGNLSFAPCRDEHLLEQIPADQGLHSLPVAAAEKLLGTDVAHHDGIRLWHCLPLANSGERLGVVYLGMPQDQEFSDEDKHLLGALGAGTMTALAFHLQRDALERAVRARDQVLAVVAHDLKNPLNVIAIAATTLLQRFSDSSARRPIDRIIRSAQRADRMIRDLVEIDAIEMGRLSLERHPIEPADVILAALDSQQALAAEASVIIGTDLSPELPGIDADEERLHGVLENLIGNAIKFTGAGGHITVGAAQRESEIMVWVKDSGVGIPPEHMPHIFDRFYQASRAERRGTGLGLTICKGIVDAHGGRIWAESVPGEGATLFFTLPATPVRVTTKKTPPVKTANILLVDDRPENLVALEAILDRPEYRLITATSGEEALSIALRETFAVALIDISMPGMNGLEVAVNLKALERSRDIPIIFITAFGNDPEEIHQAYSAGGADYLVKPLDTEIVRKKVAVFVELSRRRSGNDRARAQR